MSTNPEILLKVLRWNSLKKMKTIGIIALLSGWLVLTSWSIYTDSESKVQIISLVVLSLGILILLVSAILERIKESKNDPYKDVEI